MRIEASLAGWRSTSASFQVVGDSARTIFTERWDEGWQDRWILFGEPRPVVSVGPNGVQGFWSRGDGTYPSMGVLRRGLSARSGLGVEVRISTPLTRSTWQRMRIALVSGLDTASLRGADQQKAPPTLGRTGG